MNVPARDVRHRRHHISNRRHQIGNRRDLVRNRGDRIGVPGTRPRFGSRCPSRQPLLRARRAGGRLLAWSRSSEPARRYAELLARLPGPSQVCSHGGRLPAWLRARAKRPRYALSVSRRVPATVLTRPLAWAPARSGRVGARSSPSRGGIAGTGIGNIDCSSADQQARAEDAPNWTETQMRMNHDPLVPTSRETEPCG